MQIADWRQKVFEIYATIRAGSESIHQETWQFFRLRRDALFKLHTQSPLDSAQKSEFETLPFFDHNPTFRVLGDLEALDSDELIAIRLPEGIMHTRRIAYVHFKLPNTNKQQRLTLYWIEAYGGGLFLPFGDKTNGESTYGGGRYLYDSIKGADLGSEEGRLILDFNYAYNPSCAYNARWVCPLSPPENMLEVQVPSGEQDFNASSG